METIQLELIFSPEVSRDLVNRSPLPGSEEAKTMTVTSGLLCYKSFPKPGPVGLLAKMLLESSIWHSTRCVLTWKTKVTKSNRLLYRLQASTPRTGGIGSGLLGMLRTPTAAEWKNQEYSTQVYLQNQIAMLPTPNFTGGRTAPDNHKEERRQRGIKCGGDDLATKIVEGGKKTGTQLRLAPAFVIWMMGYPAGWCDLKDGE